MRADGGRLADSDTPTSRPQSDTGLGCAAGRTGTMNGDALEFVDVDVDDKQALDLDLDARVTPGRFPLREHGRPLSPGPVTVRG